MNDPWQILGLSRDTATEKEVKSAYARLIKQHRPDTDPEGFQRVRQAYEAAMAMVKNGLPRGEAAEPMVADTTSAPPALIEAELAVHRAREANDQEAVAQALAGLYPVCRALRPGKAGFQLWREALHRATDGRSALVAEGVKIPQMIDELESGGAVITHAVVGFWEGTRDTERLLTMAEAILADTNRLGNQDSGIVALRLALEIAFVRPALAGTLVTFAFPHIDRQAREQLIPQVEQQAALGNLMPGLRKDQTAFWHERLRNPRHAWDWNDEASQTALEYLARERGPHWQGFGIIKQVAPAEWFVRLEKAMGRRQGGFVGKFRPTTLGKPRPQPQSTGGSNGKRFGWLAIFLLINLARLLPECSNHNYTPVNIPHAPYVSRNAVPPAELMINRPSPPAPILTSRQLNPDAVLRFGQAIGADVPFAPPSRSPSSTQTTNSASERMAIAKAHAAKLLEGNKSMHVWIESSNAIGSKATAKMKEADAAQREEVWKHSWNELRNLMGQFHATNRDPAQEQRFLEILVWNPDASPLERQVALSRMTQVEQPDTFLSQWEDVINLGPQVAGQVAAAASNYLKFKAANLTSSERERMEALAKRTR